MGTVQSTHQRSNSFSGPPSSQKPSSFLDVGCLGCFPNPDRLDFNIDNAELQTHNKELVPKGKVSQTSIAYLSKEEVCFLKACSGKNISALRYYMNKGTNVNLLDEDRTSPLHIACRSGSLQVVEELINWGAAVNIADMAGWTPLHIAAYHQRPLICHLLLKKGADPYLISRNGETPWDLVKDKNTEEIFYVHFDRNDLKKMGKLKKDEPPGEIGDEDIWVNQLEVKDKAFQNKLGVDLRRGGVIEEEKSGDDYFLSSRLNPDHVPTESNMLTSTQYLSMAPESTKRSCYLSTNRTNPFRNSESHQIFGLKKSNRDRKENIPKNRSIREVSKKINNEESSMEVSNAPKKHKYYSHFRKIKALRLTDFQQNKDVLCTLESDDSCMQDNSYFSMNNSSLTGDHSFLKRKTNTCSKTIENLEDITLHNNNQVNTLDPSFLRRKGSLPAQLKQIGNPSAIPGSILTNRANLPPYRVPKQLQTNQAYLNPYNQQSNKRHSRDNSAYSVHTRRSSVSNVEKTNVSGWSFMLAAPALSIHKLISKGQKKGNNQKQKENKTFVNDIDSFVDLAPFKVEPKFLKSINNIAIQIFNNDSLRGLSFMVLFKLLRQNPKDIALFLYKAESADTFKKSQYQITQLLTNTHLKETLDILYQYSNFYQFDGLSFVEALRFYLSNFILENDPDKIDWILKGFTKRYYATMKKQEQSNKIQKGGETKRKELFETPEAVQMLAFATVMLDIELHQAIERDISFDNSEREGTIKGEFVVSLAYVNGGENFSKGFIDDIFENVKRKKVIRLLDQSNNEQAERSLRFKLESAKLMAKARKISKKDKKIIKDYLLCFDGPVCCVVKMIGEISELKAVFVTKGCKIVRAKDNKIKFRKINAEDKEEIHYGKFRTAGDIVVSSKSELVYSIETGNDVMRIQKFLESINM